VRTVSDGEAALAAIAQDPPDLVLLDIMIPGRDGYAVCRAVRRVIGILSERDIVRAFAEFGADALTKQLAQVMTREVATCREAETAVSIMERMTAGKFRHIPVVELDQLVGIVSIGDIVKHRLWVMEQESAALRDYIQSA
jgi:CBS domain-containing protein